MQTHSSQTRFPLPEPGTPPAEPELNGAQQRWPAQGRPQRGHLPQMLCDHWTNSGRRGWGGRCRPGSQRVQPAPGPTSCPSLGLGNSAALRSRSPLLGFLFLKLVRHLDLLGLFTLCFVGLFSVPAPQTNLTSPPARPQVITHPTCKPSVPISARWALATWRYQQSCGTTGSLAGGQAWQGSCGGMAQTERPVLRLWELFSATPTAGDGTRSQECTQGRSEPASQPQDGAV